MPRTKAVRLKDVQAIIYAVCIRIENLPDDKAFSRRDKRAMQEVLKALAEAIEDLTHA